MYIRNFVDQVEHSLDLLGTLGSLLAPGGKLTLAEVMNYYY